MGNLARRKTLPTSPAHQQQDESKPQKGWHPETTYNGTLLTCYLIWTILVIYNFIKMLYTGFIDLYRCYSCFILDYFLRAIFHYVFYALAISRSHTGTTPLHTWISGAGSLHLGRPSQCQHLHRWGTVPFSHGSSRQQSFGVSKSLHINCWIFTNTKNIRRL